MYFCAWSLVCVVRQVELEKRKFVWEVSMWFDYGGSGWGEWEEDCYMECAYDAQTNL